MSEAPAASVAGPEGPAPGVGAEAGAEGGGRGVAQEARHAVEDVAPLEEAAEDLRVAAVQPLAAELRRVVAGDDRDVVLELRAPEGLVHVGAEEEGVAEAERRLARAEEAA